MTAHPLDSQIYGHLWGTDEVRALFTDRGRTQMWLDVLTALAQAQAELEIIPADAAAHITDHASVDLLDLEEVAERTRATGHSTLGLIQTLQNVLDPKWSEWVYYGATVQDVSDTWTALVMKRVAAIVQRDLSAMEDDLIALAGDHRDTVMLGRTHGQPGLPITFGFKVAVWAAEVGRHRRRLHEMEPRIGVGQLAGAVGTCSFWGDDGLELQRRFCERLGLAAPDISWLTARDRVAEFVALLALVTGSVAKIGNEVYNLQRREIGELREAPSSGVVGSITMPHKNNPEAAEHLSTLARLVRAAAGLALEGLIHEHERDGAAWKAEWVYLPEACTAATVATAFGAEMVAGLEVDPARMASNIDDQHGYVMSEPVLRALSTRLGKHTAQRAVYEAALAGIDRGASFRDALASHPETAEGLADAELEALLDPASAVGLARELVDRVVEAHPARPGTA